MTVSLFSRQNLLGILHSLRYLNKGLTNQFKKNKNTLKIFATYQVIKTLTML